MDVHCSWATDTKNKQVKLIGYNHCNIEVPESFSANLANTPPISMNTLGTKNDIRDSIKKFDDVELVTQPRKKLIWNFPLQKVHWSPLSFIFFLNWFLFLQK